MVRFGKQDLILFTDLRTILITRLQRVCTPLIKGTIIYGKLISVDNQKSGSRDGNGNEARFSSPAGMAVAKSNSGSRVLWVAGSGNHVIRAISTAGQVTTIAGIAGSPGYIDGEASIAQFSGPTGLAFFNASTGLELYVTEVNNQVVRKVEMTANLQPVTVTTVAGTYNQQGLRDGAASSAWFYQPNYIEVTKTLEELPIAYVSDQGRKAPMMGSGRMHALGLRADGANHAVGDRFFLWAQADHGYNQLAYGHPFCAPQPTLKFFLPSFTINTAFNRIHEEKSERNDIIQSPPKLNGCQRLTDEDAIHLLLAQANPITISPQTSSPTSSSPSAAPSCLPSETPSFAPTFSPLTSLPTSSPTSSPESQTPSLHPSSSPSFNPTFSPLTSLPTSSPTSSPESQTPSLYPSSSPSFNPTFTPLTFLPTSTSFSPTQSPSSAPSTVAPTTESPILSSIQGFGLAPLVVETEEELPPWELYNEDGKFQLPPPAIVEGGSHAIGLFMVKNLLPNTQTLSVTCTGVDNRVRVQILVGTATSTPSADGAVGVILSGRDPTRFSCESYTSNSSTLVKCNGGDVRWHQGVIGPQQCTFPYLVSLSVVEEDFICPFLPHEGQGASSEASSLGVFRLRALDNGQETSEGYSNSGLSCTTASLTSGATGEFRVGVTIRDVVFPEITDFLVELPTSGFRSSVISNDGPLSLVSDVSEPSSSSTWRRLGYAVTLSSATRVIVTFKQVEGVPGLGDARCPQVTVGGVNVSLESCFAQNVTFLTPSFAALCSDPRSDCGYHRVRIKNPDKMTSLRAKGGVVECPGKCPLAGLGFFYTPRCVGYMAPEECSTLTEDQQDRCAYGAGDACRKCDPNAICPGGFRMWPGIGHWTSHERAGSVILCPSPADVRCLGWDYARSESRCGDGYTGTQCASCSDGYYKRLNECVICPEESQRIVTLLLVVSIAIVLFLVTYTCQLLSPMVRGRPELKGLVMWQTKDFVVWSLKTIQLASMVIVTAGATAPAAQELFTWINILNINFEVIAPECYSSTMHVFLFEKVLFSTVLAALVLMHGPPKCLKRCRIGNRFPLLGPRLYNLLDLRGSAITFLIGVYTPCAFFATGVAYCIESNTYDEGSNSSDSVLVSWANPNLVCGGDEHFPALILAVVVLIVYSIGFPIYTFFKMQSFRNCKDQTSKRIKVHQLCYKKFFGDDYFPRYHWMRQAYQLVCLTIVSTRVYLSAFDFATQLAHIGINSFFTVLFIGVLLCTKPYVRHMSWKLPVQISILVLILSLSALEFLNFLYLANMGGVSQGAVEAVSYSLFLLALLNFTVLSVAFYFVVFRKKEPHYYAMHFMLQKHAARIGLAIEMNDELMIMSAGGASSKPAGEHKRSESIAGSMSDYSNNTPSMDHQRLSSRVPLSMHSSKASSGKEAEASGGVVKIFGRGLDKRQIELIQMRDARNFDIDIKKLNAISRAESSVHNMNPIYSYAEDADSSAAQARSSRHKASCQLVPSSSRACEAAEVRIQQSTCRCHLYKKTVAFGCKPER
eukprot:jgi/Bigna1/75085/fgenesh1_pg.32_\